MFTRFVCLALVTLSCALFAMTAPLDPHTTVLPTYWLPADAKADGNLAKWKGIPAVIQPEQFKLGESDTPLTPTADFAPSVYLGRKHNSPDLFVLVLVKDRCVMGTESAGWAFGDCLELYLDFGRGARAAANAEWWKDTNKWNNAPEMSQFGFLPQTPADPGKVFRGPNARHWQLDYASVPVRGGFVYEVRIDGASVLADLKLKELPAQIGLELLIRGIDYPVVLDGAGWANHHGYLRLFGNWMDAFNPSVYGGVSTASREPEGDALPAQTLSALYGDSPTLDTLRTALKAKKGGEEIAELLYWTAFQGQVIDAPLVRQLMNSDTPRMREVCLQLMLDPAQDKAARKAAAELAYRHLATASPLELTCANLLHKALGKGHGPDLLYQISHKDLTVAITAADALRATGNKDDLAAFRKTCAEVLATIDKDPTRKSTAGAARAYLQPALDGMTLRLTPPPAPKATLQRTLEAKNTDLARVFAIDNNTVYNGAGLLRAWPPSGPKELWRAEIGSGLAAVTEAAGHTFAMGSQDGKAYAFCFDAATGKLVWKQLLSETKPGYGAASPLVDGPDHVYFTLPSAVACLKTTDGSVVWKETKAYGGAEFSSPLITGDLLFVPGSTLVAVDKRTGQERWRVKGPAVSPASPALMVVDGIAQIILAVGNGAAGELWGISAKDGAVFWKYPIRSDNGLCASPVVDGSRVLFSAGDAGRECFTALQMAVQDGVIRAFPAFIRTDAQANYAHTLAVWNGLVFGFGSHGLECDNAGTGEPIWRNSNGWATDAQCIVADGLLFLQSKKNLILAEAGKRGYQELARFPLPYNITSQQPTLANGRLYVRGETAVVCYAVGKAK